MCSMQHLQLIDDSKTVWLALWINAPCTYGDVNIEMCRICLVCTLTMFTLGCRSLDFLHYVFKLFPVSIIKVLEFVCVRVHDETVVQLSAGVFRCDAWVGDSQEYAVASYTGLRYPEEFDSSPWLLLDFVYCVHESFVFCRDSSEMQI